MNKIAYTILKNDLKTFKDKINPAKYDGAILLGVNGYQEKVMGVLHHMLFHCAIERCFEFIKNELNKKISKSKKTIIK